MIHREVDELVPLYALDALDGGELESFEEHLDTCPECVAAVDEYLSVTSTLVPDEPASEEAWQRISAAIAEDHSNLALVTPIHQPAANRRGWHWIAGVAAAAAVFFGGFVVVQLTGPAGPTDTSIVAAADQAAAEDDAIVEEFIVDEASVARVVLASDGRGFVIPSALDALDRDRTYQLWVINREGEAISAGVLGSDPAPATFTWTGEVSGFALTREVAGGVVSSAGDVVSAITDV